MADKAKAKAKKYGKKASKVGDLAAEFASFHISDSPPQVLSSNTSPKYHPSAYGPPSSITPRRPLRARSGNRAGSPPASRPSRSRAVSEVYTNLAIPSAYYQPLLDATGVAAYERFDRWAEVANERLIVTKIGDGSYADVYKFAEREDRTQYVIGKLMPIRSEEKGVMWDEMTSVEDAITEIRLLDLVTEIPGFVEYRAAHVLYGPLPESIATITHTFNSRRNQEKPRSDNRQGRATKRDDQVWLLLEMSDAGRDLDTLLQEDGLDGPLELTKDPESEEMRLDIRKTRDLFWATATTLAHGEEQAQFEHRDLHLSNICVKEDKSRPSDESYAFVPDSTQLDVVLIDYTLSRAGDGENVIYNSMSDSEIFTGKGDLQFDIYRHMRNAVKENGKPQWNQFKPLTNVLWLHHLLVKLLQKTHQPQPSDDLPRKLWERMVQLRDNTKPRMLAKGGTYLSAKDLLAMGKGEEKVQ